MGLLDKVKARFANIPTEGDFGDEAECDLPPVHPDGDDNIVAPKDKEPKKAGRRRA